MEDSDLARALAADLDGHFAALVLAYQRRLFTLALRLTHSPRDAEELAQDAFVRAYRALAAYPAERIRALRLEPWLYRIALNVTRSALSARRPRSRSLEGDAVGEVATLLAPVSERPEVAHARAEATDTLARALAALPPHLRVAVVLRHVEGRGYAEMADVLGQPVGTVKSHVHRGTRLLRRTLAACHAEMEVS